mgnify:FL=1
MGIPAYTDSVVREIHNGASISFSIIMHTVDHIRVTEINNATIRRRLWVRQPGASAGAYRDMCRRMERR